MGERITDWKREYYRRNNGERQGQFVIWRKIAGIGNSVMYEMYTEWTDTKTDLLFTHWVGGGTFVLEKFGNDDVERALGEFNKDRWDVHRDELARYLFMCNTNIFNHIMRFNNIIDADRYLLTLKRMSLWNED